MKHQSSETRSSKVYGYLSRLFGGLKMTWTNVIIFAVGTGVFTGLMALLVPANNSFHDIAVNLEAWVLFALIIITNCEKPLESSLKTLFRCIYDRHNFAQRVTYYKTIN